MSHASNFELHCWDNDHYAKCSEADEWLVASVGDNITFDVPGDPTTAVSPAGGWWSQHSWEVWALLGAVGGYMLLMLNARIAGASARALR